MKKLSRKHKIAFGFLISCAMVATMGASCSGFGGSGKPLWEDPGAPARQVNEVLDANSKAVEDIKHGAGKGAKSVGDWFGEFSKGWSDAGARRAAHKAPTGDEDPSPVPDCDWSEFGPCEQPPPLIYFGIIDDNNNGVPDDKE